MNIAVLILTCDKNADISFFVKTTLSNFKKCSVRGYISTETMISVYDGYDCFSNPFSFSRRIVECLTRIKEDFVLILLDDYYVYDRKLAVKIKEWETEINENNLSLLKICNDGKIYKKTKRGKQKTKIYKKMNVYDIDFHPTIWNKFVLIDILLGKDLSPWEIEPLFVSYLSKHKNICGISGYKLSYDELIVGGKFFRRAFKRHCKNKYDGQRKVLTYFEDLMFRLKRFVRHIIPRFGINMIKKIFKKTGYSDLYKKEK